MPYRPTAGVLMAIWRALRGYRTLMMGSLLGIATLGTGLIGWGQAGETGFVHRLYLTLLAFGGDPIYAVGLREGMPLSGYLLWARFFGIATTLVALFALLSAVLGNSVSRLRARWRKGHAVLIGSSLFGLERLRRIAPGKSVTILCGLDMSAYAKAGELLVNVDPDASGSVLPLMGKPAIVLFGSRDTVRNVARARAILPEVPQLETSLLRVEDIALVRDLAQLAPELAPAQPISSSETLAEAVVFALTAPEMAKLRGQPGVHIVIIGMGATNLALAEQLAATCYHPRQEGMDRLRLTVLDCDAKGAEARLHGRSPGLTNVAKIVFRQMDGLDCRGTDCLRKLRAIERLQPVTAICVATGDDARNAAIGMRLRQIQLERLILKAPVLLRNHVRVGHAPGPFTEISGGLYDFGGDQDAVQDPKLEQFEEALAAQMHARWYDQAYEEWTEQLRYDKPQKWTALTSAQKRSSRLAARAAPHVLRAADLVPDPGAVAADMRVAPGAVSLLRDRMAHLKRLEHERWMAEKRLDGFVWAGVDVSRDDERRRHPALVPWEELSLRDQEKDIANVDLMIENCRDRAVPDMPSWRWRWRWRVGVMGPLAVPAEAAQGIEDAFARYLADWENAQLDRPVPLDAVSLEVLTPDAPGFDRVAAAAITKAWTRTTGRRCRVTQLRAAGPALLDEMAASQLVGDEKGNAAKLLRAKALIAFSRQSQLLQKCGSPFIRTADLRLPNVSDAQLRTRNDAGAYPAFEASTQRVAEHISTLSDLVVWGAVDGTGAQTRAIAESRKRQAQPTLEVVLPAGET